jgi:hypothetical protein
VLTDLDTLTRELDGNARTSTSISSDADVDHEKSYGSCLVQVPDNGKAIRQPPMTHSVTKFTFRSE